jgi:diguanylate cyclase (GGDEF)-like protein/PAS domain S-box-containing protein
VIALAVGVSVSVTMSVHERRSVEATASKAFHDTAGNVSDQARLHMSRYEDLLASFQVAHRSSTDPSDESFGHLLGNKAEERPYPGYQAAIIKMRENTAPQFEDLRSMHVEPHRHSPASIGISERNRATLADAMQRAVDTGANAMSGPLALSPGDDGPVNLAVFAPLYRDGTTPESVRDRRLAFVGWVGVVFRADQMFSEVLARSANGVGIEIFDGSPNDGQRIAVRPRGFTPFDGTVRLTAVPVPGKLWTLRIQPLPDHSGGRTAQIILIAGVLLSALLALFIGSLGRTKNHALRLAGTRTLDLRRSEQRFRSLATSSPLGIFGVSVNGECEYANERLCELTGRSLDELAGDGLAAAYHPDDRAALRKAVTKGAKAASALRLRIVLPDGSLRWVKTHAAPLRDEDDRLTGWVGSVEDVTTEVQAQVASQQLAAELAHQAHHDYLTGLGNRPHFTDQIDELLTVEDVGGAAVLFFDIDRFKVVNDSLGHDAGDRMLIAVAEQLLATIRPGDIAARFGGDEFVVGLVGVSDDETAVAEAQRLMDALNMRLMLDGHEVPVSVSMGVALPTPGADAEALLTRADSAMYRAKSRGKARVELYRASTPSRLENSTLEQERQLRHAIDNHELLVHYQPIVEIRGGAIMGAEALVRWQHPQRGLLAPGDFIPLAEESGLILPLGTVVLREACAQLRRWSDVVGSRSFHMTVNVSARQLADPVFPSVVATALSDFGVDPAALCLEITESALLQDIDTAEQALRDLRRIGVLIAVDDFGTGYSSLSHLKQFPIDMLKIDRSFVSDLGRNADNTAIVGAVIRLAGALGLDVVAEGVEDADQADWLASMGCELAQGYFFARPQVAERIDVLLREPAAAPARAAG